MPTIPCILRDDAGYTYGFAGVQLLTRLNGIFVIFRVLGTCTTMYYRRFSAHVLPNSQLIALVDNRWSMVRAEGSSQTLLRHGLYLWSMLTALSGPTHPLFPVSSF